MPLKINLLTLSVILIRSIMYMKAAARWLPSWRPGTRWNPMRSALSLRISRGPSTVSLVIPSIQWLVTAMYGTRFGSLQRSIVSGIRPRAPWNSYRGPNQYMIQFQLAQLTCMSCSNHLRWISRVLRTCARIVVRCGMSESLRSSQSIRKMFRSLVPSRMLRDCHVCRHSDASNRELHFDLLDHQTQSTWQLHQQNPPLKTFVKLPHYHTQQIHCERYDTHQSPGLPILLWPWCLSDRKLIATGECGHVPSASLVLLNYWCRQNAWHIYVCLLPVHDCEFNQPLCFEYKLWDQELTHKEYKTSGLILH